MKVTGDTYLYRRAEAELKMAARATDPSAARVHYALANHYFDRFYNPGGERTPQVRAVAG